MPYIGPNDPKLPASVKDRPQDDRSQWVSIWNSTYEDCRDEGGSVNDCEGEAFRNANGVVMNELHFVVNRINDVKRKKVDGVEYLIAPLVMQEEGIYKGEYVSQDELHDKPKAWNGRPIILEHPTDPEGYPVSANDPDIIRQRKIGEVYHAKADGAKLKSEAWIDVDRANSIAGGPDVVSALENGRMLEVSTSYFRDRVEEGGIFNGHAYEAKSVNHRPDHLAILLNAEGECSIRDGCGIPRANQGGDDVIVNIRSTARTPEYDGTTSGEWNAPSLEECVRGYNSNTGGDVDEGSDVEELPNEAKSWIASLSLLGESGADDFRNLLFFPVVEPSSMNLNENALGAVISGRGAQADIPADALESARNVARRLLNEEYDRDLEANNVNMNINVEAPEGVDEKTIGEQIAQGMAKFFGFRQNEKECCMEKIQDILDSGLVAFSEEELEAMDEEKLESLHEFVTNREEEVETNEEEDEDEEDVEAQEDEDVEEQPDVSPELRKVLDAEFEEFGGLAGVKETMTELQANKKAQRETIVNKLVANDRCPIEKGRLEMLPLEVLEDLDRSFAPADYSGQGGNGLQSHKKGDELETYSAPALVEKE